MLLYERTGYGQREACPTAEPDSVTIVGELSRLLAAAALSPPYLVVGHSWSEILAGEFLPPAGLCGMVLVDAVQERMLFETSPDPCIAAVTAGLRAPLARSMFPTDTPVVRHLRRIGRWPRPQQQSPTFLLYEEP